MDSNAVGLGVRMRHHGSVARVVQPVAKAPIVCHAARGDCGWISTAAHLVPLVMVAFMTTGKPGRGVESDTCSCSPSMASARLNSNTCTGTHTFHKETRVVCDAVARVVDGQRDVVGAKLGKRNVERAGKLRALSRGAASTTKQ